MLDRFYVSLEKVAGMLLALGGTIVVIQSVWISYGVMMRYVFNNPDGTVTEATALLLFPVAFLGLSYALKEDAYPKVTMFRDRLSPKASLLVDRFNFLVMTLIGAFFTASAIKATLKNFSSGAASEILLWPKVYFWIPVALSLIVFTLYALLKTIRPHKQENY